MIRIGLVGSGFWADAMYLPALNKFEHGKIVAIAGNRQESTNTLVEKWNLDIGFSGNYSWKTMIDTTDLDAVIIASPTHTHYEIAKYALQKGLHVLCEKPLASTLEQAQELADIAKENDLINMVGFTYSWLPNVATLMSHAKKLDKFIMRWYCDVMYKIYDGEDTMPDKINKKKGNRLFADIASHMIYITNKMFGEISHVKILEWQKSDQEKTSTFEPSEIDGAVELHYKNGQQGFIELVTTIPSLSDYGMSHQWNFAGPDELVSYSKDWNDEDIAHYKHIFRETDVFARKFVLNIINHEQTSPSFEDGVQVQKVLEMIYEKTDV